MYCLQRQYVVSRLYRGFLFFGFPKTVPRVPRVPRISRFSSVPVCSPNFGISKGPALYTSIDDIRAAILQQRNKNTYANKDVYEWQRIAVSFLKLHKSSREIITTKLADVSALTLLLEDFVIKSEGCFPPVLNALITDVFVHMFKSFVMLSTPHQFTNFIGVVNTALRRMLNLKDTNTHGDITDTHVITNTHVNITDIYIGMQQDVAEAYTRIILNLGQIFEVADTRANLIQKMTPAQICEVCKFLKNNTLWIVCAFEHNCTILYHQCDVLIDTYLFDMLELCADFHTHTHRPVPVPVYTHVCIII